MLPTARLSGKGITMNCLKPLSALLALAVLALVGCGAQEGADSPWTAWMPQAGAEGKLTWREAPETLSWRAGEPGEPERILTVTLPGPYPEGAWVQHAGAVLTLPEPIPAGQPFRIRFMARSLEGSPYLSALRRWGSSKPWRHVTLTGQWAPYEMIKVCEGHETEWITFSLALKPSGLHTVQEGRFELADVAVTPAPDVQAEDLPTR